MVRRLSYSNHDSYSDALNRICGGTSLDRFVAASLRHRMQSPATPCDGKVSCLSLWNRVRPIVLPKHACRILHGRSPGMHCDGSGVLGAIVARSKLHAW
jgi:hypothetical protein